MLKREPGSAQAPSDPCGADEREHRLDLESDGSPSQGTPPTSEQLFDLSQEYDAMLNRGIRLSGESKRFFIEGRIRDLAQQLTGGPPVRRILDFGCGIGDTARLLADWFPEARVLGIDTAASAVSHARKTHECDRVSFQTVAEFQAGDIASRAPFDLCYTNGVFHHIPPAERVGAARLIRESLADTGVFALFENNPWNPGTRLVMSRIPFDRDAQPIPPPAARRLLAEAGFSRCRPTRSLFYFPRVLAALRPLERSLVSIPLGAQYCVLAAR